MAKGILYGVGVGPGDPKLMTLKAVETISRCQVVAAPRTKSGGMLALDIAKGAMELSSKTILPLDFSMSPDPEVRAKSHLAACEAVKAHLDNGTDVAMLNLGDVSIYASFHYLWDRLQPQGYQMEMVAGVTSFCAAAALLGIGLTDIASPIHIIPDAETTDSSAFFLEGTKIWMKAGRRLPELLALLKEKGLMQNAFVVQNCGLPEQKIYLGEAGLAADGRYFSLVIVK